MIINPCRKCVVKSCCTDECKPSMIRKTIIRQLTAPIKPVTEPLNNKEWITFSIMSLLYLILAIASVYLVILLY